MLLLRSRRDRVDRVVGGVTGPHRARVLHAARVEVLLGADLVGSLDAHLLLLDVTVGCLLAGANDLALIESNDDDVNKIL